MLGETLGAAGPTQVIALLETMRDGVLPGIKNLEQVEDDFEFEMIGPDNREIDLEKALISSVGFDGHCCSLVVAKCDEG
jgi:3-oxoacyl-[acyl-carrier-protein] synthase II